MSVQRAVASGDLRDERVLGRVDWAPGPGRSSRSPGAMGERLLARVGEAVLEALGPL